MPSAIANGICVIAKMAPNFKNASKKPAEVGKAKASCAEVVTYVDKSLRATARKTPTEVGKCDFLQATQITYATIGPTIPIEKVLAPRVVIPPCASSSAWKSKAIIERTDVTMGPNMTAAKPEPVGCELLPVTEGSFSAEMTKMNAPISARSGLVSGSCFVIFESL